MKDSSQFDKKKMLTLSNILDLPGLLESLTYFSFFPGTTNRYNHQPKKLTKTKIMKVVAKERSPFQELKVLRFYYW